MKKTLTCILLAAISFCVSGCIGLATHTLIDKKCYGLSTCTQNPSQCQHDENGAYQMKSSASCKMDGGHTA